MASLRLAALLTETIRDTSMLGQQLARLRSQVAAVPPSAIPEHSLVRIPLVRQALLDPHFRISPRAVDTTWQQRGHIPLRVTGFNPFTATGYYGARSPLATWLEDPMQPARPLNEGDELVAQVLMLTHDYLHVWAYNFIRARRPELLSGKGPLNEEAVQEQVFLLLLTEACATAGLDYWYLGFQHLNELVDIGTKFNHRGLTTEFHGATTEPELRRVGMDLTIREPRFFELLISCYCKGSWDLPSTSHSPLLSHWLDHEVKYGALQRAYGRRWLLRIAGTPCDFSREQGFLQRPIRYGQTWQVELVQEIAEALWSKVSSYEPTPLAGEPAFASPWTESAHLPLDFALTNLNRLADADLEVAELDGFTAEQFDYFFYQALSRCVYGTVRPAVVTNLNVLRKSGSLSLVTDVLRDAEKLPMTAPEPAQLMLLN